MKHFYKTLSLALCAMAVSCAPKSTPITAIHNLLILDASGSMQELTQAAVDGVNRTIKTIREAQDSCAYMTQYFSLVQFNAKKDEKARITTLIKDTPIAELPDEFSVNQFKPYGMTPLYDAVAGAVKGIEKKVGKNEVVLVTIITDGIENASRSYDAGDIKILVGKKKRLGWTFTYIGANQKSSQVATQMGIDNYMDYMRTNADLERMWRDENEARRRYYERARRDSLRRRSTDKKYFEK